MQDSEGKEQGEGVEAGRGRVGSLEASWSLRILRESEREQLGERARRAGEDTRSPRARRRTLVQGEAERERSRCIVSQASVIESIFIQA